MLPDIKKFGPDCSVADGIGPLVYTAIERGVALMNFHTALDVCDAGASQIPELLNLKVEKVACPTPINFELDNGATSGGKNRTAAKNRTGAAAKKQSAAAKKQAKALAKANLGFGRICKVAGGDRGAGKGKITLYKLRERCESAFGRTPRV